MPSTAIAVTDQLLTSTAWARKKKLDSMIDINRPFVAELERRGRETENGGERMIVNWKFNRHSRTTQLGNGYEPIDHTVDPIGTPGNQTWGDWVRPVLISEHEEILNRGAHKIFGIVESRTKDTLLGMKEEFNQALLAGGLAAWSDCLTLNGIDDAAGILEHDAVGSQANTLHAISKATYATAPGMQNQLQDVASSFSTGGLPAIYALLTAVEINAPEASDHAWFMTSAFANNYKRAVQPQERYTGTDGDAAKRFMMIGGIKGFVEAHLPTTGTTTTANPLSAMLLDFKMIKWVMQAGYWFKMSEFRTLSNYLVRAAYLHHFGQLRAQWLGSSGLIIKAETW